MIFVTITQPRKKAGFLLKCFLVLLLLAFVAPSIYGMVAETISLQEYSDSEEEEYPGEPMRVDLDLYGEESEYWADIEMMMYGE